MVKLQSLLIDKGLDSKSSGIYLIYCSANQRGYIGRARNINSRWKTHKTRLRRNVHENPHLQRSWNKYGEGVFNFIVVEHCPFSEGHLREEYWIREVKDGDNLFNMRTVDGIISFKLPKESIEKMKNSLKRRICTEKEKERLRTLNLGKKRSDQAIEKTAKRLKEHYLSKKELGSKLTREQAIKIKNSPAFSTKDMERIALEYNVSFTTVYDIKKERTWRNLNDNNFN